MQGTPTPSPLLTIFKLKKEQRQTTVYIILKGIYQILQISLTLFDMGGGHDGPPKMFLTTVPKRLVGGS